MKTLSGTFAFVALAVIAIVTLPSCCRKGVSKKKDQKVYLEFGKFETTPREYVELGDNMKDKFDKVLCRLPKDQYHVEFKANAEATPDPDYTPPPSSCRQGSINTDKITTSRVARSEPAEESSAYDPHVVYNVQSNSTKDIKDVVNTFKD
jgi:hypothetical protein